MSLHARFEWGDEVQIYSGSVLISAAFRGMYVLDKDGKPEVWYVFQVGEVVYVKPASSFGDEPVQKMKPLAYKCVG